MKYILDTVVIFLNRGNGDPDVHELVSVKAGSQFLRIIASFWIQALELDLNQRCFWLRKYLDEGKNNLTLIVINIGVGMAIVRLLEAVIVTELNSLPNGLVGLHLLGNFIQLALWQGMEVQFVAQISQHGYIAPRRQGGHTACLMVGNG